MTSTVSTARRMAGGALAVVLLGSGAAYAGGSAGPGSNPPPGGSAPAPQPDKHDDKGTHWGDDDTGQSAKAQRDGAWRADLDAGSLWSVAEQIGAHKAWASKDASGRPLTGQGVDVALLDSGIAPVPGLAGEGKVLDGPDLSFESQATGVLHLDTFGHGTHMAGIIAGSDRTEDAKAKAKAYADPARFSGIAPDARLVSLKLAGTDGSVDVSQVIAGVNWVAEHARDPGVAIRVLNLSYGTDSLQDAQVDPLAHAVEAAWRAGVVVVVSAGNEGAAATRLTMPAMDPYVIAVGADHHAGTLRTDDDRVADFTSAGSSARRPDLLAPGASVVSLRDPGSLVDVAHPEGLVSGDASGRYFRGSGTSQAAAVVSGAVALLLQQRPELTPDQVKALLLGSARPLAADPSPVQGAGLLDIAGALKAKTPTAVATWPVSTGTGSLDAARGGSYVADAETGELLTGERDVLGGVWDASAWAAATTAGRTWDGGRWNGQTWTAGWTSGQSATDWDGLRWSGLRWSGLRWSAAQWEGLRWSGLRWSGLRWSGLRWSGLRWSGLRWSDGSWDGLRWSGAGWTADDWDGLRWSGLRWSDGSWQGLRWSDSLWSAGRWA